MNDLVKRLRETYDFCLEELLQTTDEAADRIEELETINEANLMRITELEVGMAFIIDAIENGDDVEFIPEKKM